MRNENKRHRRMLYERVRSENKCCRMCAMKISAVGEGVEWN